VQILASIEDFSKENRWLKVAGGEKGQILESIISPGDRVLEVGSYIGFTALRLAQHGCEVVTIEADPLNAAVAQEIVEMASLATMDGTMNGTRGSQISSRVKICVGRASDWLSSGLLDPVDVILLDHRGTIYHEERR
jgi:predicted O-methyltransferase YrrM